MRHRWKIIAILSTIAVLLLLALFGLIYYRVIVFTRSKEIAGGLTTGGWQIERDSLDAVTRGYFIIFKDDTVISNTLTYEKVVPFAAVGSDDFILGFGELDSDYLAYAVNVSAEDDQIVLSVPIPSEPNRWQLFLRKVVNDTSNGNYSIELVGKWRIFGSEIFDIGNPIRDGDSGTIEFFLNGDVTMTMDRPPEISYGFEFPDIERFGVVDKFLLLYGHTELPVVYKIHSLGSLLVLERSEQVPWILVPVEE